MANWNPKKDPQPDRKDIAMFKTFLKFKYDDRRFQESPKKREVSQDSSDDVKEKKKKKKSRKSK